MLRFQAAAIPGEIYFAPGPRGRSKILCRDGVLKHQHGRACGRRWFDWRGQCARRCCAWRHEYYPDQEHYPDTTTNRADGHRTRRETQPVFRNLISKLHIASLLMEVQARGALSPKSQ